MDSDGICDSSYNISVNDIDFLPLAYNSAITSTPTPTTLSPEVEAWDTNHDGIIQKSEAIIAVINYFSGGITKANAIAVVIAFFS